MALSVFIVIFSYKYLWDVECYIRKHSSYKCSSDLEVVIGRTVLVLRKIIKSVERIKERNFLGANPLHKAFPTKLQNGICESVDYVKSSFLNRTIRKV
jgi:hypothetical protein